MRTKLFTLLFVCLSCFSCRRVLYYAAGLRTPKEETNESLKEFVNNFNLDTTQIYIPKDTAAFYKLNKISSGLGGYAFFDKEYKMLKYKDTGTACSAPVYLYVKNICGATELFYKKYSTNLITDRIKPICFNQKENNLTYDYYIFIFWAKYLGKKKFQDEVKSIADTLAISKCRVRIYFVDLDLQPGWKKDVPIKFGS